MWQECEPAIGRKIAPSYEVRASDIRRVVNFLNSLNPPSAPESPFFCTLGTPAQQHCHPLSSILAQRTKEEWARTLCENKAVAIMQRMQEGIATFINCPVALSGSASNAFKCKPRKKHQRLENRGDPAKK